MRKNIFPGQTSNDALKIDNTNDTFPSSESPNTKTHEVMYSLIESSSIDTSYTDPTGRFPYRSSQSSVYILVVYHYDTNRILTQPVKNRQAATLVQAWKVVNDRFMKTGQKLS